ncbi:hypothetical protein W911_14325 [Hyphomicrobium nitrativorans NL23]|uniref:Uncharacterized protein n=1 Tax=Hyphomicrobium nitrativorans NL23 TaxID=1029756 RepID=V5SIL5_9HYPH|nr:hypothetical protein [Hyphomicrobium nitrativorans]AHB50322.1 hypothetical protein W911_14325 [Hyphomicrobium nitrativorans NL23]
MTREDRIKEELHAALLTEAEKLSELPPEQEKAGLILLFAGAEIRMGERIHGIDSELTHSSEHYMRGREIANRIKI